MGLGVEETQRPHGGAPACAGRTARGGVACDRSCARRRPRERASGCGAGGRARSPAWVWTDAEVSDVYYLALLYHIGCTGAVAAQSRLGAGDDVNGASVDVRGRLCQPAGDDAYRASRSSPATGDRPGGRRAWRAGDRRPRPAGGVREYRRGRGTALAATRREPGRHRVALPRVWTVGRQDLPALPSGDGLSRPARLVHLVHVAQIYHQAGGVDAADGVVRQRSGSEFDPQLAALVAERQSAISSARCRSTSMWDHVLEAEPEPHRRVGQRTLDEVSAALADFVDLASPFTARPFRTRVHDWLRPRRCMPAWTRTPWRPCDEPDRSTTSAWSAFRTASG